MHRSTTTCHPTTTILIPGPTITVTVQSTQAVNATFSSHVGYSTEVDADPNHGTAPFYFQVASGTTNWLSDIAPTDSSVSFTTATTTILVVPSPSPLTNYLLSHPAGGKNSTSSFATILSTTASENTTTTHSTAFLILPTTLTRTVTSNRSRSWGTAVSRSRASAWNVSTIDSDLTATLPRTLSAHESVLTLYIPGAVASNIVITVTDGQTFVPAPTHGASNHVSESPSPYRHTSPVMWLNNATATSRSAGSNSTSCTEQRGYNSTATPHTASNFLTLSTPISALPRPLTSVPGSSSLFYLNSTTTSIVSSSTSTASALPVPLVCGESGNFTLNWDDEPAFNPEDPRVDPWVPVFNPYHHMFFSNGYAYIPPGADGEPFAAISSPHLAIFLPNLTETDIGSPNAAGENPGEIGAGPRASLDAFWFDAYSVYAGCDNAGPNDCTFTITGYVYDAVELKQVSAVTQRASLAPCGGGMLNCSLTQLTFDGAFRGLSGIQFDARVGGEEAIFLLDNLELGWFNNTCAAGLLRQRSRK